MSAIDWVGGGWDIEECVLFTQALRERGLERLLGEIRTVQP